MNRRPVRSKKFREAKEGVVIASIVGVEEETVIDQVWMFYLNYACIIYTLASI